MTRRAPWPLLLVLLLLHAPAAAAAGAARAHARTPAHAGAAGGHAAASGPNRTLDEIHIEGEIPVPQVLFVTAREQRRFLEFQHHRYLRTGRQLAEATVVPDWIVVTRSPLTSTQETPR